ncbi:hypothetical protein V5O48_015984 [Marasmius crinis-equi]|uniref:Uncharacterized protein n=1 Tax=Marasmius crinis-equi TaxID=585013 RepID=A0ABR3ET05_9AGAR
MLEGRSGVKVDVGPSVVERKVFEIGELFDLILQYVVEALYAVIASELGVEVEEGKEEEAEEEEEGEEQVDDTNAQGDNEGDNNNDAFNASNSEKSTSRITDPPSALTYLRTLLSFAQVDRWFYHALLRNPPRQHLFPQLTRNFGFGWMLPFIPADFTRNWKGRRRRSGR